MSEYDGDRQTKVAVAPAGVRSEPGIQQHSQLFLRPGGTLVPVGWGRFSQKLAKARDVFVQELLMAPFDADRHARIGEQLATREIQVVIGKALPLAEAARAHELSGSRRVRGKLVLYLEEDMPSSSAVE